MSEGYMYILECGDGSYYTGSTVDLQKRLWEHQNNQGANYTKKKQPVKLIYFEEFSRIDEAFYREKQVQGWSHAKKKALIESRTDKLPELAKKDFSKQSSRYAAAQLLDDQALDYQQNESPVVEYSASDKSASVVEYSASDKSASVVECSAPRAECIETTSAGVGA